MNIYIESRKVKGIFLICIGDKRKIEVPQVVVHRAAARKPADNGDILFLYKGGVYLLPGVLVFPYNYRVVILPEHKIAVFAVKPVKHKLFQSQVAVRVCVKAFDVVNHFWETNFFQSEGETPVLFLKSREK